MTSIEWSDDDLDRIAVAEEIQIRTDRRDGTHRTPVPVWTVVVDGNLYARSYRGTGGAWYRHATHRPAGSILARGRPYNVTFQPADPADPAVRAAVDAAYQAKYARYGATYLKPMLTEQAAAATARLAPRH